jgi:hypothetical protein
VFAGLEDADDEDMTTRWGNLLANAATDSAADVLPSFPDILRQLIPRQAAALDHLVDDEGRSKSLFTSGIREDHDLSRPEMDDLLRLNLVRYRSSENKTLGGAQPSFINEEFWIDATSLGCAFVMACRAPVPAEAGDEAEQ